MIAAAKGVGFDRARPASRTIDRERNCRIEGQHEVDAPPQRSLDVGAPHPGRGARPVEDDRAADRPGTTAARASCSVSRTFLSVGTSGCRARAAGPSGRAWRASARRRTERCRRRRGHRPPAQPSGAHARLPRPRARHPPGAAGRGERRGPRSAAPCRPRASPRRAVAEVPISSCTVFRGVSPSMIAASPNWRSRSISSVRLLVCVRGGDREVRRDDRLAGAALRREDRDHASAFDSVLGEAARAAFSTTKSSASDVAGSDSTSAMPASSAQCTSSLEGVRSRRSTGTAECSRSAASCSRGSDRSQ